MGKSSNGDGVRNHVMGETGKEGGWLVGVPPMIVTSVADCSQVKGTHSGPRPHRAWRIPRR